MAQENLAEGQETKAPQTEGQEQVESPSQPQELSPESLLEQTGFKSLDEVAKSLKEGQTKITQLGQEKSQLEQSLQAEYGQREVQPQRVQAPAEGQAKDFYADPVGNVQAISQEEAYKAAYKVVRTQKISEDIAELKAKNTPLFNIVRPYMDAVYAKKPWLEREGKTGLDKAFKEGLVLMKETAKQWKSIIDGDDALVGDAGTAPNEEEIRQKVLDEIETNKAGHLPQTGGARAVATTQHKKIKDAAAKGDVDGTLDAIFK